MARKPTAKKPPRDWRQEVTDKIVGMLESGTNPWQRPWRKTPPPMNVISGKRYSGINRMLLELDEDVVETGDPRFMTFEQAKAKGWSVRKGSKAKVVMFYKKVSKTEEDDNGEEQDRSFMILKAHPVFHASAIDGIPPFPQAEANFEPWESLDAVETILEKSGANLKIEGDRAFYAPALDMITLPPPELFSSAAGHAAVALHELGHWTGAKHRLDRDLTGHFGSESYAKEELRAEIASAFMCSEIGIDSTLENHASYLQSWLKALKNDKGEIFRAVSAAQKIADMCLAFHPDYDPETGFDHGDDGLDDAIVVEEVAPSPAL